MRKHRKLLRGMVPAVMAAAVVSAATGQAWAAPAQPGTVKESEKPAAQPGTEKAEKKKEAPPKPVTEQAAPKPVTQEAPPKPVTQEAPPKPVTQEAPPKPVTEQAAPKPVTNSVVAEGPAVEPVRSQGNEPNVTPVRGQFEQPEVTSVRDSQETTAVEAEYQPVALETDLDDSKVPTTTETDDVIRPEEEEDAEDLTDNDDEDDEDDNDVDTAKAETPVEQPVLDPVPTAEEPIISETVEDQPSATTFSGGAALKGEAAGVGVGVDTTAASTTVSGEVNALGQEGIGHVQTTAVDDQTIEIAVNDFEPVSIQTTVTDQSASVSVNDSTPLTVDIPQVDVPAEVVTAVDQAATDATAAANQLAGQAEQFAESLPDAGDFEAQLPAGLTASAWFQSN